jgi:hypothetical protein
LRQYRGLTSAAQFRGEEMPKSPVPELPPPMAKLLVLPKSKKPRHETAERPKGSGTRSKIPAAVVHDEVSGENLPFRTKSFPPIKLTSSLNDAKPDKPCGHIPPFSQPKQAIPDASDPL